MKRTLSLLVLVLILASGLSAQKTEAALSVLATQHPTEKVYIHYDKGYYVAGETIWFKAYLYSNGLPSTLSNNFYLQLLGEDGKLISNKKYPVKGATVNGDIELPDSLPQGYYHVRALTPAMLNSNQEFLYSKNIFVFNNGVKPTNDFTVSRAPGVSLQFFPESGHLVAEILSVIAFKATDSLGKPANISGVIKTDDGTLITFFKTTGGGMGKVQFRTQAGKKYVAAVEMNGQTVFYPLPEVMPSGVNLKIENEKGGKMFLLSRSKSNDLNKLVLTAEMNNMIVYESEINFDKFFSVKGHLLTDSLPSGILHFTVFDKEGNALAERLTFVNNGEYESNATIEIIKKGTGPREENVFEISFPDIAQRSCSVAVTDEEITPTDPKENIISKLLLTDDLKGVVENPAWYFGETTDSVRQTALDNLLFTRGWSRFSWEKILSGVYPEKKHSDQYLITVAGYLKDRKTGETVSDGGLTVFLESEDSVNQSFEVPVNGEGKFRIDSLLCYGKAKLFYAYKTAQGREKSVNIFVNQLPVDIAVERMPFSPSEDDIAAISADPFLEEAMIDKKHSASNSPLAKTKELDPVVVESKTNKRPLDVVNEKYTSGVFTGLGKLNIDNINQPNNDKSISAFDYIKNFVRQVEVQDNNFVNRKNFSLTAAPTMAQEKAKRDKEQASGSPYSSPGDKLDFTNTPGKKFIVALFLNESVTDIGALKTIRMDEIALIKFYEPGFIGAGSGGPGGTLSVYTKKEVNVDERLEKLDQVVFNGYSISKDFNSPDYSIPNTKQGLDDARNTLYWNPQVYTDAGSKKVTLRFYNNDFSKRLRIIVEGFDAAGRLIHIEKTISN